MRNIPIFGQGTRGWNTNIKAEKFIRGKKGQEMLIDFWVIAGFAAILLLFLIFFFLTKNGVTNNLKGAYFNKDSGLWLDAFLRAPAVGIDETKSVSEIMIEDYYIDDYRRSFDLFKRFYPGAKEYAGSKVESIKVCLQKGNAKIMGFEKKPDGSYSKDAKCDENSAPIISTSTYIPDPSGGAIKVILNIKLDNPTCVYILMWNRCIWM